MFKILRKTFETGIVTRSYPERPAQVCTNFRGRPEFDLGQWSDSRPAAEVCPTGAIRVQDTGLARQVTIDYGRCVFCGLCAEVSGGAVTVTREFELAVQQRGDLVFSAEYALNQDGTNQSLVRITQPAGGQNDPGRNLRRTVHSVLGRSLAIREVDAGSCNGCELEIVALNNPVYDMERLGIHFVASPRHADMLLVTGVVTRNMEQALLKTYRATPEPKVVVAVGACGVSGGIFGVNYATVGGVDRVVPVDVYIPGCPPRPEALIHGILVAVGRLAQKLEGRPGR
ncbi:MAG: NADH-quinone oxidoreductase subunit NuoB [Acidobacteria bacterium]|nr:NADH-quinone oxidoreductase subunit NuoB [Acidobacteriota bacterium]